MFKYVDVIDITLMDYPYQRISALFDSDKSAKNFCKENGELVRSVDRSLDRDMLTERTYLFKDGYEKREDS